MESSFLYFRYSNDALAFFLFFPGKKGNRGDIAKETLDIFSL